jgi:hypothetical protein
MAGGFSHTPRYLLNTWLVSVQKNGSRITTAIAEDQQSQNRYIITAKVPPACFPLFVRLGRGDAPPATSR